MRHGQSTWNVEGRVQGQTGHPPLTSLGREQARRAAEELRGCGAARVLSSDLARAHETAEIIAQALALPLETTPLLREQALGGMEGKRYDELMALPTPEGQHDSEVRWGGGESLQDVMDRAREFLRLLQTGEEQDLVVVSHGETLRVLLTLLDGRTHREIDWDFPINNGEVLVREI